MEGILQQYSIYQEKVYPADQVKFLKFNPTVHTKQFEENGHVGLGYISTHSHAIQPLVNLSEDIKFPILSGFVKSENLLFCVNATTFEVLVFNVQNGKDFNLAYSFNLKENILSKYSTGKISNGKDDDLIFKSNTLVWQFEYSENDNSLIVLLLDYGTPSIYTIKPTTIVKIDLKGQVDWICKDEFCENGLVIKENSNIICGVNTSGVVTECYHTDGSEVNPKVTVRVTKQSPSNYHNFQMTHYRDRYLFPELSGVGMNPSTNNDCAYIDTVDETGVALECSSHPILHPFSIEEKGGFVHTLALDRKRGLVFSLVNPGPLASICISHLGSRAQLFTMGPFFVSNTYCKMIVNESDQILHVITLSVERSALEIHTFEYGRFKESYLEETRRKNVELWKSEKYLTAEHQSNLKTNAERRVNHLTNTMKTRLEAIEASRELKNINTIKEEIFIHGRLVSISQSDLKSAHELELVKSAPQEKHQKMVRIMEELGKNRDIVY